MLYLIKYSIYLNAKYNLKYFLTKNMVYYDGHSIIFVLHLLIFGNSLFIVVISHKSHAELK